MGIAIVFLVFFNFAVSWWNAYAAGRIWVEAKFAGGWPRFMAWCAAVMSACGFSWCILIMLAVLGHGISPEYVNAKAMNAAFQLGYILLIPFILVSGWAITFDSWAQAWRERSLLNMGVAGYNTFASVYNTYNAIKDIPKCFEGLSDFFNSKDSEDNKGAGAIFVIGLVLISLSAGALLTTVIIKRTAGSVPLPEYKALKAA